MRWQLGRRSDNVEDRRGVGPKTVGVGGLFLIGIVVALLGGDPTQFFMQGLQQGIQMQLQSNGPTLPEQEQTELVDFVKAILGTTEDSWSEQFKTTEQNYQPPYLVVFNGFAESACGSASSAVGPFYCPMDRTIYLDLQFFHDLKKQFNAPGDFAQAYVIAHEVGHHIQNELGILKRNQASASTRGTHSQNQISVLTELMADCFAGIWAHDTQDLLDSGDIEEALQAASQIGDDTLQKKSQGYVVPDSFTHGSAQQRVEWFTKGYRSGSIEACDTFQR